MIDLSPRQLDTLRFIVGYSDLEGYPPSIREIARGLGIASTNGVKEFLDALRKKGAILRRPPGMARAIVVTPAGRAALGDP